MTERFKAGRGKEESEKKPELRIGKKYFLPHLGKVLTYYGRGNFNTVLVTDSGARISSPHIFGDWGGLRTAGVTDEQAKEAVLVHQ